MRVYDFIKDWYLRDTPAKKLSWKSVLLVGFRTRHAGMGAEGLVDVFPNMSRKSYHVVVLHCDSLAIYPWAYSQAERIVHIDGAHIDKQRLSWKSDALVWWHESIQRTGKSTVVMKEGWHSQCLRCGECCSNIGVLKGKTVLESLSVSCKTCHKASKVMVCSYLKIHSTHTGCSMYKTRPNCCASYPNRLPTCSHLVPTCGLFNKAYIESRKEYEELERKLDV